MLLFLISCLWLIVFARTIAFRATLANTTFAVFALLGAVIGPLALDALLQANPNAHRPRHNSER